MAEQREYHLEEIRGYAAGGPTPARIAELRREGWVGAVIQSAQRLDGSTLLVLIMSRPYTVTESMGPARGPMAALPAGSPSTDPGDGCQS